MAALGQEHAAQVMDRQEMRQLVCALSEALALRLLNQEPVDQQHMISYCKKSG